MRRRRQRPVCVRNVADAISGRRQFSRAVRDASSWNRRAGIVPAVSSPGVVVACAVGGTNLLIARVSRIVAAKEVVTDDHAGADITLNCTVGPCAPVVLDHVVGRLVDENCGIGFVGSDLAPSVEPLNK